MKKALASLLFLAMGIAQAQDGSYKLSENIVANGYVKFMQQNHLPDDGAVYSNHIWHNRFNLKVYLPKNFTLGIGMRNRLLYGEELRSNQELGNLLIQNNDAYPAEVKWYNHKGVIAHTNFDRLWLDWSYKKTDIRIGKQRINWGIHTVWNPNDIFNTFNFVDFDYEERPGSDAVKIEQFIGDFSSLEFVYKLNDEGDDDFAVKYQWNTYSYDIQTIAGRYRNDYVLGAGWAGPIKNAGFKGEFMYYIPRDSENNETSILSLGFDYSFKNGYYLNSGYLYQSNGFNEANALAPLLFALNPSAKQLMPSKHSAFFQMSKQHSPLLTTDIALIHAINMEFWFVMPSVHYSLRQDLDLSLIGQIAHSGVENSPITTDSQVYLRLKYSF